MAELFHRVEGKGANDFNQFQESAVAWYHICSVIIGWEMQNVETNQWRVEKSLKNLKETAATITTWLTNRTQKRKEIYCNFLLIKRKQSYWSNNKKRFTHGPKSKKSFSKRIIPKSIMPWFIVLKSCIMTNIDTIKSKGNVLGWNIIMCWGNLIISKSSNWINCWKSTPMRKKSQRLGLIL